MHLQFHQVFDRLSINALNFWLFLPLTFLDFFGNFYDKIAPQNYWTFPIFIKNVIKCFSFCLKISINDVHRSNKLLLSKSMCSMKWDKKLLKWQIIASKFIYIPMFDWEYLPRILVTTHRKIESSKKKLLKNLASLFKFHMIPNVQQLIWMSKSTQCW